MPQICFSYSPDVPPGIRDRDAAQRAARNLRRMPMPGNPSGCFSYPADVLPGIKDRDAAQRAARDLRRMPGSCFRY